jgi:membrane protein DedA with SNARE-associated domain
MDAEPPVAGQPAAAPPSRRRLYFLLGPIIGLTVLAYVGDFTWAALVEDHPLWLISLNTRKRYLALVVPHTDPIPYYLVGTIRQVISDPLFFLLGRWYGDAGVRWLEKKMGEGGSMVRFMERGFAKASWPMVAVFPNALICMLAGASAMPVWLFFVLNVGGTFAAMVVLRAFGDVFGSPLTAFTGFVSDYRLPIIAVSGVLVAVNIALNKKKGTSDLEALSEIEKELEAEARREGDNRP